MTEATAKRVHESVLRASSAVDDAVAIVQAEGDADDLRNCRLGAARVLDAIMEELLKPIYRAHPRLIPPELDRDFFEL
jgi:hypothetical protein